MSDTREPQPDLPERDAQIAAEAEEFKARKASLIPELRLPSDEDEEADVPREFLLAQQIEDFLEENKETILSQDVLDASAGMTLVHISGGKRRDSVSAWIAIQAYNILKNPDIQSKLPQDKWRQIEQKIQDEKLLETAAQSALVYIEESKKGEASSAWHAVKVYNILKNSDIQSKLPQDKWRRIEQVIQDQTLIEAAAQRTLEDIKLVQQGVSSACWAVQGYSCLIDPVVHSKLPKDKWRRIEKGILSQNLLDAAQQSTLELVRKSQLANTGASLDLLLLYDDLQFVASNLREQGERKLGDRTKIVDGSTSMSPRPEERSY